MKAARTATPTSADGRPVGPADPPALMAPGRPRPAPRRAARRTGRRADGGVDRGAGRPVARAARGRGRSTSNAAAIGAGSARPVGATRAIVRRRQQLDREDVLEDLEGLRRALGGERRVRRVVLDAEVERADVERRRAGGQPQLGVAHGGRVAQQPAALLDRARRPTSLEEQLGDRAPTGGSCAGRRAGPTWAIAGRSASSARARAIGWKLPLLSIRPDAMSTSGLSSIALSSIVTWRRRGCR